MLELSTLNVGFTSRLELDHQQRKRFPSLRPCVINLDLETRIRFLIQSRKLVTAKEKMQLV